MRIDAVLVDLDGVIRRWPDADAAIEFRHGLPPGAIRTAAFAPARLMPVILGHVSDDAWREQVSRDLRPLSGDAAAAVAEWSAAPGEVDGPVAELLQGWRRRARLVLATNATSRLLRDLQVLGLASAFDAIANSSEIGAAKPDPAFFRAALGLAGTAAAHALFIDDSAANVEAARRCGITGHTFVGTQELAAFLMQAAA